MAHPQLLFMCWTLHNETCLLLFHIYYQTHIKMQCIVFIYLSMWKMMLFLCHGQGFKINWQLCWWYLQCVIQMTIWLGSTKFILCVSHFEKKLLTAICASKHAHYTFCIVIQMRIGGSLDIFFIKVGNWIWIIFGLQHIGWLKFNCFHLHLIWHGTNIHWKQNGKWIESVFLIFQIAKSRFKFNFSGNDNWCLLVRVGRLTTAKIGKMSEVVIDQLSFPKT